MANKKIVLFLGAGFSAPAGFPTMKSFIGYFTDCPNRYPWDKSRQPDMDHEAFDGLQAAWHHAHKSVPVEPAHNLESVFCLIDFHYTINPSWKIAYYEKGASHLSRPDGMCIKDVKRQFVRAIWHVYNRPPQWEEAQEAFYKGMFEFLCKTNLSIVTTNYDLLPEAALRAISVASYYPNIPRAAGKVPIYKLHGSANWFRRHFDDDTEEPCLKENQQSIPEGFEPFIAPPTWHKKVLGKVWKGAVRKIAESDKVYIIGCGFAATDIHIRYFLSTALGASYSGKGQRDVIVINPDREAFCKVCNLIDTANKAKGNDIRMVRWYKNIAEALEKDTFSG